MPCLKGVAGMNDDEMMKRTVALARQAADAGDVNGIAAIVAMDGEVVAEGVNEVHLDSDPTRHAEIVAISRAASKLGRASLAGATLYTSLQPCEMCLAAMRFAEIDRVVFAATQPHVDGKYFMFPALGIEAFEAAAKTPFEWHGGRLEEEVIDLYRDGNE